MLKNGRTGAGYQIAELRQLVVGNQDPAMAFSCFFDFLDSGALEGYEQSPVSRAMCRKEYPGMLEALSEKLSEVLGSDGQSDAFRFLVAASPESTLSFY